MRLVGGAQPTTMVKSSGGDGPKTKECICCGIEVKQELPDQSASSTSASTPPACYCLCCQNVFAESERTAASSQLSNLPTAEDIKSFIDGQYLTSGLARNSDPACRHDEMNGYNIISAVFQFIHDRQNIAPPAALASLERAEDLQTSLSVRREVITAYIALRRIYQGYVVTKKSGENLFSKVLTKL